MLVYGEAGSGKTAAIGSLPSPVVVSAEAGLMPLSGLDISFVTVNTMAELEEFLVWLYKSDDAKRFGSVAVDSVTEIAEVCLSNELKARNDGRQAYGAMQDKIGEMVRALRDIPTHNVYMIAHAERAQDEQGRMLWSPTIPGNKFMQRLPHFFDEVLAIRVSQSEDGETMRAIQAHPDGVWSAKDRSGNLEKWETAETVLANGKTCLDMGAVIRKIGGAE